MGVVLASANAVAEAMRGMFDSRKGSVVRLESDLEISSMVSFPAGTVVSFLRLHRGGFSPRKFIAESPKGPDGAWYVYVCTHEGLRQTVRKEGAPRPRGGRRPLGYEDPSIIDRT